MHRDRTESPITNRSKGTLKEQELRRNNKKKRTVLFSMNQRAGEVRYLRCPTLPLYLSHQHPAPPLLDKYRTGMSETNFRVVETETSTKYI